MMPFMDAMATTTTATGCVWSSLGAAGAPEAGSEGSAELRGGDTGLHPDAPSTGSLCRVRRSSRSFYLALDAGRLLLE